MPIVTPLRPVAAPTFSGRRMRLVRRQAGLSLDALADRLGRNFTTVRAYERGTTKPSADALGALAHLLGCPIDDLYEVPAEVSTTE